MDLSTLNLFNVFLNPFTLLAMKVTCGSEFHNIMRCSVKKYSFYFLQTYCLIILFGAFSPRVTNAVNYYPLVTFFSLFTILQPIKSLSVLYFSEKSSSLFKIFSYGKHSLPLIILVTALYTFMSFTIFIWRGERWGVLYMGWKACVCHRFLQWYKVSYAVFAKHPIFL